MRLVYLTAHDTPLHVNPPRKTSSNYRLFHEARAEACFRNSDWKGLIQSLRRLL